MKTATMSELVQDYLEFKRKCGYQMRCEGTELLLFARHTDQTGYRGPITTQIVVQWAKRTKSTDPVYWAIRYDVVRRFAKYRFLFDPNTEIPPKRLLGSSKHRAFPHISSDEEIAALFHAASLLKPANGLQPHTYTTLFGLLLSTGLRISEALDLFRENIIKSRTTVGRSDYHVKPVFLNQPLNGFRRCSDFNPAVILIELEFISQFLELFLCLDHAMGLNICKIDVRGHVA
jgi:site-specific recombinase XerD